MQEMLQAIVNKLDKIQDDVTEIKVEQATQGRDIARNSSDIAEHIRRTNLLEASLDKHAQENDTFQVSVEEKIREINKPLSAKDLFKYVSVGIGVLASLSAAVYSIFKIFGNVP
jgi:hypothetical protein